MRKNEAVELKPIYKTWPTTTSDDSDDEKDRHRGRRRGRQPIDGVFAPDIEGLTEEEAAKRMQEYKREKSRLATRRHRDMKRAVYAEQEEDGIVPVMRKLLLLLGKKLDKALIRYNYNRHLHVLQLLSTPSMKLQSTTHVL